MRGRSGQSFICSTAVEPFAEVEEQRENTSLKHALEAVALYSLPLLVYDFERNVLVWRPSMESQNNELWRVGLVRVTISRPTNRGQQQFSVTKLGTNAKRGRTFSRKYVGVLDLSMRSG